MHKTVDFVVVGSGIAGLTFALRASQHGSVLVITKKDDAESATNMAQGGIAAVMGESDSFEQHIEDTLRAGVGLCNRDVVELAVREGPGSVARLMELGVRFSMSDDAQDGTALALGQEGGHSSRRIVHASDMTGREIERGLLAAIGESKNVELWEDHIAIDLVLSEGTGGQRACLGVHVLDVQSASVRTVRSAVTVLATGGCGKVYLYTTNPDIATGDGVAMAHRAGVAVRNMEFIQFHPTCLYHPDVKSFLISEAVRGEGAVLKRISGERIMEGVHPREDLAPRDIVARTIDRNLKTSGDKHVVLDITHVDPERVRKRFPNIHGRLLELGLDMTAQPIPVVPAAHYLCGGIQIDTYCKTSLAGLYACGEAAHTGMHGANRLASNSLLEAAVFSERGARAAIAELEERRGGLTSETVMEWESVEPGTIPEGVMIDYNWDIVRRLMWDYVGIVRSERRLALALERIEAIRNEVTYYFGNRPLSSDIVELRNITLVGELIVRSALRRKESRGLHWLEDHPDKDDERFLRDTVIDGRVDA